MGLRTEAHVVRLIIIIDAVEQARTQESVLQGSLIELQKFAHLDVSIASSRASVACLTALCSLFTASCAPPCEPLMLERHEIEVPNCSTADNHMRKESTDQPRCPLVLQRLVGSIALSISEGIALHRVDPALQLCRELLVSATALSGGRRPNCIGCACYREKSWSRGTLRTAACAVSDGQLLRLALVRVACASRTAGQIGQSAQDGPILPEAPLGLHQPRALARLGVVRGSLLAQRLQTVLHCALAHA
jgi:hypothetical protein